MFSQNGYLGAINSNDKMGVLRILAWSDFSVAELSYTEEYLSYLLFARSCHLGVKREEGLQDGED